VSSKPADTTTSDYYSSHELLGASQASNELRLPEPIPIGVTCEPSVPQSPSAHPFLAAWPTSGFHFLYANNPVITAKNTLRTPLASIQIHMHTIHRVYADSVCLPFRSDRLVRNPRGNPDVWKDLEYSNHRIASFHQCVILYPESAFRDSEIHSCSLTT